MDKRKFQVSQKLLDGWCVAILVLILAALCVGSVWMTTCMRAEEEAFENRAEFLRLGQDMRDGSDYLTEQARMYAVRRDTESMFNYWYEVHTVQRRDKAIQALEAANPPEQELQSLKQAKQNSDRLIEAETHAMRLISDSISMPEGNMPAEVAGYFLPPEEAALPDGEKWALARTIMFDDFYSDSKDRIMSPIDLFQNKMERRLNRVVDQTRGKTATATNALIVLDILIAGLLAGVLCVNRRMIDKPIRSYSRALRRPKNPNRPLSPCGTAELVQLGEHLNGLAEGMQSELNYRRKTEEELRRERDRAERANRVKSEFLAQMSHEIRTPLSAVKGYAQLLEQTQLTGQQQEYLQTIVDSAGCLTEIIRNILDYSKLETGKFALEENDFDFLALLRGLMAMFRVAAGEKGLLLIAEIEDTVPRYLRGDRSCLHHIFMNLLSNAVKFTDSGSVTLRVQLVSLRHEIAQLRISVEDTGIGISEQDQRRIFDAFVQSDSSISRQYGGTGLGLSICRQMLALMHGNLEVKSELNSGSVFTVTLLLPLGSEDRVRAAATEGYLSPRLFAGRLALVVDDNPVNLRLERDILSGLGFAVHEASGGAPAVALCEQYVYDIVLMDVRMAGMDGVQASREIQRKGKNRKTPIVSLSADESLQACSNPVFAGHLSKLADRRQLAGVLASLLHLAPPKEDGQKSMQTAKKLLLQFRRGEWEAVQLWCQSRTLLRGLLTDQEQNCLEQAAAAFRFGDCADILAGAIGEG